MSISRLIKVDVHHVSGKKVRGSDFKKVAEKWGMDGLTMREIKKILESRYSED